MSNRCLKQGLFMLRLLVPSDNINRDEYIPVQTCYRCYKLNDHNTLQCPENISFRLCSLCSSWEHNWKQCNSKLKKCCFCGESHSSLSMTCSLRKSAVARERSARVPARQNAYASVAATSSPSSVAASFMQPSLMSDALKASSCITLPLLKNEQSPSSFRSSPDL